MHFTSITSRLLCLVSAGAAAAVCLALLAAPLTAQEPEAFTFVVVGDPHLIENRQGFPPGVEAFKALLAAVKARPTQPDFMIITGDIILPVDANKQPDSTPLLEAAKGIPIHVVFGNNDSVRGREALRQMFPQDFAERDFYSFTHKGCRFVMTCDAAVGDHVGHFSSEHIKGGPQWPWLKEQLKRDGSVRRVFLFGHAPPHPTGAEGNMYLGLGDQLLLADVAAKEKPDAFFFGHLHRKLQFSLAGCPVYVARSSLWNFDNEPPGFIEVRVQADAVAVDYVDIAPPAAK